MFLLVFGGEQIMRSQCQVIGKPQPKTWDEYEQNCISTFGGGYHEQDDLRIFQHGMRTIFNLLRNEFPEPSEILGTGGKN